MIRQSVIALLLVAISLLAAWPAAAAQPAEVDVIFLVDTSASMSDELQVLCRGIGDMVSHMDERGVTMYTLTLGIADTGDCADQRVSLLISESQIQHKEDWGPAVADLARYYEWTPGAARLIIPLSDEGPLNGDPVNEDDDEAIQAAIQAAQDNDVIVSPVLGTDFTAGVKPLAQELAKQTGGRVFISQEPEQDLLEGLQDLLRAASDHTRAANDLLSAIPTPRDVARDGSAISANLVLAVLLTVVLGVASTVRENTWSAHGASFEASGLGRVWAALVDVERAAEQWMSPAGWSRTPRSQRLMALAPWAFSLLALAFLSLFLQPDLGLLSWRGLGLWLGMLLALTLVSLIYEGGQYWLARQTDVRPELRVRPWALLAAVFSVALSRLVGFLPGYFYCRLSACAPPPDEPQAGAQPSQWWRQVVLLGLGAVGAIGLSMWLLTIPTSLLIDFIKGVTVLEALTKLLSGLVGLLQGLLLLGFFVAWQTLFFELLPLQSSAGGVLFRRNRLLWAGISCLVLFVLLHTLLNPLGTDSELLQNKGLLLLLLSLFIHSALAVAVWFYFARRPASEPESGLPATRESWERDQLTAVLAISLVVIWVLGACYGLLRLVMGWLG